MDVPKGSGDILFNVVMPMSAAYNHPVNDPLYAAHKEVQEFDDPEQRNFTRYVADDPIKAVSCLQQVSVHRYDTVLTQR